MYWFQLQESIGPIVINVSRVVADIFTMSISLLLFCMAFTFGIVFVLNIDQVDPSQSEILNSTNNQNSTIQQTMVRRMRSSFERKKSVNSIPQRFQKWFRYKGILCTKFTHLNSFALEFPP